MLIEVAKTNELTLDWLVAKCQGFDGRSYCPSSHASDGYEILDKAGIICGHTPFVGSNYAAAIGCNLEDGEFILMSVKPRPSGRSDSHVKISEELVN